MITSFHLPELYGKYSGTVAKHSLNLIIKYKHLIKWPANASILEYGFGDGSNYKFSVEPNFSADYKEYFATDISKVMLDFAKYSLKEVNISFQELDIKSPTIPDSLTNRFDLILSFFTNHLIQEPKQMFKNINRMLKPGGQTFQITLERSPLDIVFHNLSKNPKWAKYNHKQIISPYYYFSDPKEAVERTIQNEDFKNYTIMKEPCIYEFDTKEQWQGLFLSCNPLLSNIQKQELEEYKEDYLNEIQNNVIVYDDKINKNDVGIVKNTLYVISAIKN